MEDITKTGPVGLKGLKYNNKAGANTPASNLLQAQAELARQGKYGALSRTTLPTTKRNVGLELSELGYGESMYDSHAVTMDQARNLQDVRAQEQPWFAQIGAGVAKMGVLAATTFLDGIVGTFAGIANVIAEGTSGNINSFKDGLYSFIDNPFSKMMQGINEAAESWIPNYYTQYEQEQPWYTQIGTANFIGDKFLKNFGFTIGAAGAAMTTAGAAGRVFVKKGIREAFKGVVNAAGKELKTGAEIYKAYKAGDAFMNGAKLTKDLAKSAKTLKRAETNLKLLGAVSSAMGEGRIEAITNADEWEKNAVGHLDEKHNNYAQALEDEMFEEHPEYFSIDENGNKVLTNPIAINEYNEKIKQERANYEQARAEISAQKASIANSIFGLNVALLSTSNLIQFGRAITGGYTSGRNFKNLVSGSIKSKYDINKNLIKNTRLRALASPLTEVQEEMSQASISEGSGLWGSSKINDRFGSFYGGKIDPDAEAETQNWLGSILQGFANSYGNIDRWEEGFIGGLTGLLAIPKIKKKTKANGKKGWSITLDGELWQGLKDARDMKKEATEVAEYLNKRIQDPEFINYYQGHIRHKKLENDKENSLDKGDAFEFKNAEHAQIISDAIMFEKAGRLQDFYDMIEESGTLELEDVDNLRQLAIDKETGKSIFEGMTDKQVVDHVRKQAEDTKKTVDKYVEISNNLKTLYGDNISSDVLEELVWGFTQVDNWESRLKQMMEEIKKPLLDKAAAIKDRFGVDIEVTLNNLADFGANFNEDKNLIDEINEVINDKNLSVQEGRDKIEAAIKKNQQKVKENNLKLGRDILKMRRKFKASAERIEKQREKALAKMTSLEEEKERVEEVREEELNDNDKLKQNILDTLQEAYDDLKNFRKSKRYASARIIDRQRYEALEEQLLQQIKDLEEGKIDIYHSFQSTLDQIDKELSWAEAAFNAEYVLDKRFKKGYDPNTRAVAIGNESAEGTQMVSEAEAEARHNTKEKNYNLLFKIMKLKNTLASPENTLMSPLETEKIIEQLFDMIKILAARDKFIDTYQGLSDHPELFQEKFINQIESAQAAHVEKVINKTIEDIKNINTLGELREILSNIENPELIPRIIEKIKEEKDEKLKKIVDEYDSIEDMRSIILGKGGESTGIIGTLLKESSENKEQDEKERERIIAAARLIDDTLDVSDTMQNVKEILFKAIKDKEKSDPQFTEILNKILDKYSKLQKSKNSNKKDKKAERKIKENNTKHKNHFEDLEDDEEEEVDKEKKDKSNSKPRKHLDDLEDDIDFDDTDEDDSENDETPADSKREDDFITKTLKEATEEELDEVIDGTSELLEDLNDKDKKAVKKLAELIKQQRTAPAVHIGAKDNDISETNQAPEKKSETSRHRSWRYTKYDIDSLKDRKKRKAVLSRSRIVTVLDALGAYDFVDKGMLGVLLQDNPDLPIHYITAPSKEGLEDVVLLAIEVTDDVEAINPITGSDGKQYQVVGSLGYNSHDKEAQKNYIAILEGLKKERKGKTEEYIVSEKYVNTVSHIYSGRIVKSTEDSDVATRNVKDVIGNEPLYLGIFYKNGEFRTPTLTDSEVVEPNTNNKNPREGSVWLMTREADGRYYPKAVQVKRLTNEEWNFEEHKNTPIMERIMDSLKVLADPEASDYERSLAKFELSTILYFPGNAQFVFTEDIISLKDSNGNTVVNNIGEGKNVEEKAVDMLHALEKLNLRFQISFKNMSSRADIDDIMKSNILTTDLAMLHNVNASFDMPLLNPETGKPMINVKPEETKGHTGQRGVLSSLLSTTVIIGNNRYSLLENGTVLLNDKEVTDQKVIDEVKFKNQVTSGEIEPVEGDENLYLGTYSNSKEFGLYNGKIITGDELEDLKEKAAKRVKTKNQKKAVEKAVEELDDEDEDTTLFSSAKKINGREEEDVDFSDDEEDDDLFDNASRIKVREEEEFDDEEDDGDFLTLAAKFKQKSNNEDSDTSSPAPVSKPDIGLGETFTPKNTDKTNADFQKLCLNNMKILRDNGVLPINVMQYATKNNVDLSNIKTKEDLEGLINNMHCKK